MGTIFISYSHDSDAHKEKVLSFSERLRKEGFETSLDQYINGTPAEGWPRWMLDQLENASFVLAICTETYYRRFRGHEKPGVGKGGDYEGYMITQTLYDKRSQNVKFVPILFAPNCEQYIPEPLRGCANYLVMSEENLGSLCDFLRGVKAPEPGPVGKPPQKKRRTGEPLTFGDTGAKGRPPQPDEISGPKPPELPDGPLKDLFVRMTPDIRECIGKVKLIANCKQIHDYLHELLQNVIRPLREEVLSLWVQEGMLTQSMEKKISSYMKKATKHEGAIRDAGRLISVEHRVLLDSLDKLVQWLESWNEELDSPDSQMSMTDFAENLDKFTQVVQDAFSEADRSMTTEESCLRDHYVALLASLREGRQNCSLEPFDNIRLEEELTKVQANRRRVQESLTIHHLWQEANDKLHELDDFRETDRFSKQLDHYREFALPTKLHPLVANELLKAEKEREGSTETIQGGCAALVQPISPRSSKNCSYACGLFIDRLKLLKERLEGLRDTCDATAFDNVRIPFYDAFYCVDKRTLVEVTNAEGRVRDLEEWLDRLASQGR